MIKVLDRFVSPALLIALALTMLLPIYTDSSFFFPYISPKAVMFRAIIQIAGVMWLLVAAWGGSLKWKIDWPTIIFAAYLVVMYLASLLGPDFRFSFWSYVERSEGLLLWTHLFVFFLLLRNIVSSPRAWNILFEIFFLASQVVAVIGLLQYLGVDFINAPGAGEARVASTIGNAAFLAGYLLFSVFIGFYLSLQKTPDKLLRLYWWLGPLVTGFYLLYKTGSKGLLGFIIYISIAAIAMVIINWKLRGKLYLLYYWLAIAVQVFVMFQTGTRGAMLGLIGSLALFFFYNLLFGSLTRYRLVVGLSAAVCIGVAVFIFANKNASWVQSSLALSRLTSISLNDNTATARLMTWESAWKGFKERPLLGYGQENFNRVFNKYFNPKIYVHSNSRVWYDRAHNIFIDHLITGGIIGLTLFLALLFYPLVVLFRAFHRSEADVQEKISLQMLFLSLVGFLIQGIFVFESLVIYLPLLLIIAYSARFSRREVLWTMPDKLVKVVSLAAVVALIPAFYFSNIREVRANLTVISALRYEQNPLVAYNMYIQAIEAGSSGTQEYRRRLAEFVDGLVVNQRVSPDQAKIYVSRADEELEKRIVENPADVANYIMYMRHLNTTYMLDHTRLYKVEPLGFKALEYSPTRPQIYYDLGYAQYYLSEYYKGQNLEQDRKQALAKMEEYFQKSIDLNPQVKESYINMIMTLLATNQPDKVQAYFDTMDQRAIRYKDGDTLTRVANSAASARNYEFAAKTYLWLTELFPDNPEYFVQASVSFACNRQTDRAVQLAQEAKKFGGSYVTQSDDFIQRLGGKDFDFESFCQ